jgi:hypothetical protein
MTKWATHVRPVQCGAGRCGKTIPAGEWFALIGPNQNLRRCTTCVQQIRTDAIPPTLHAPTPEQVEAVRQGRREDGRFDADSMRQKLFEAMKKGGRIGEDQWAKLEP